jgi:phosphatidylserine/phosphatidylglycerophosphate/cardiolipin synthase-like enzyme
LAAARAGAVVSLVTRSPASPDLANAFGALRAFGGRTVFVDNLHAKGLLWFGDSTRDKAAFVGSHNFTLASEHHSVELGLFALGEGLVENTVYRDLKTFISELMNPRTISGWRRTPCCQPATWRNTNGRNLQRRTQCH